jgi:hypothetical protein
MGSHLVPLLDLSPQLPRDHDDALRWGIDHEESRAAAVAVPAIHSRARREEGTTIMRRPAHALGKPSRFLPGLFLVRPAPEAGANLSGTFLVPTPTGASWSAAQVTRGGGAQRSTPLLGR